MNGFHFLRPEWFWGFSVFLLLPFFLIRSGKQGGLWQKLCDTALLRFQLVAGSGRHLFLPFFLVAAAWTLTLVSLAGPAWEKRPQPAVKKGTDTVYVLDVSVLMTPTDVKPSRMERARFKLHDLLQKGKDGQNALILYAKDPFVAAPLTTDKRIIDTMLPTVQAGIMGNGMPDLAKALDGAFDLLTQGHTSGGRVVVLSGYVVDDSLPEILSKAEEIKEAGHTVSFLGIGTDHGGPLQLSDGSFLTHQGKPVLSALSSKNMKRAAQTGGGVYQPVALGDEDIDAMLSDTPDSAAGRPFSGKDETKADAWKDFGATLCLFILPFAAFGYRKGWLGILLLTVLLPSAARAWTVSDLWTRPDRRAALAVSAGEKPENPEIFKDPAWRGAAAYKAGNYSAAVEALAGADDPETLYNRGNALAQAGQYAQAIETYKRVLEKASDHADAAFNKKYLEDQLKQNRQNQQQNQKQDQQQNQKQDQQQQNKQDQQQDRQSQQDQQQQNQHNQRQDQQNQQNQQQDQQNQKQDQQQQNEQDRQNQQDREQRQEQKAQTEQSEQKKDNSPSSGRQGQAERKTKEEREKKEQMQWLGVIEDDPSGLLRERIRRHNLTKRKGR